MIQAISSAIKAKLDTLAWTWKPLVAVVDYHTEKATGFPFACFEIMGFENEILDTCNNLRTYEYVVLVFQDIRDDSWRWTAIKTLEKAVDEIVQAFDEDYTLSGLVSRVVPVRADIRPYLTANGKAVVASLEIKIETSNFIR